MIEIGGRRVNCDVYELQEDVGTVVFCNQSAVGVIALVDLCNNAEGGIPFVATSIPEFHSWITENRGGRLGFEGIVGMLCYLLMIKGLI